MVIDGDGAELQPPSTGLRVLGIELPAAAVQSCALDLVKALWGDERLGARTPVGAPDLPLGVPVEGAAMARIAARA
jgi:hypothetical protein